MENKMETLNQVNSQLSVVRENLTDIMEESMSLPNILSLMTQVDEGMINASVEDMTALMEKAELKVDSYKYIIDKFESESERLANKIKDFQASKKVIDSKVERIKSLLVFSMQKNSFTKFNGEEYKVRLQASKSVAVKREPAAMDMVESPEFVRVKYEWVKPEIKKALDSGKEISFAEFKESLAPIFTVNKGAAE
jgi:hypothetical protein